MSPSLVGPGLDGMFVPQPAFPSWTLAMRQAERTLRSGDLTQAEALYKDALMMVRDGMAYGPPREACTCLAALVSTSTCLAELQIDRAQMQQAALTLAQAHETLIELLIHHARSSDWHRAAAWYVRQTHDWLVRHLTIHGPDASVERALRKACVLVRCSRTAGGADVLIDT